MEMLYSTTILSFLKKVKKMALEILRDEMGIHVGHSRFSYQEYSYPLHFIIFEHTSRLGSFKSDLFEIGINKLFLLENEVGIKEILRHELAHLITFLEHGEGVTAHGKEFREICKRYRWPEAVSRATVPIEKAVKNQKIVKKVHKLLSLATSSNPSEAKEAARKAQYLLRKYHVHYVPQEEELVLLRILEKKRGSAKLQAIASILKNFYVYPVFNKGTKGIYLEIIGDKISAQIGEYVAHFLDERFEALWKEAQREDPYLKGQGFKNSFFRGLAEGYEGEKEESYALISLQNQLTTFAQKIYPHLSSMNSAAKHHEKGAQKGREKGKQLKIHNGMPHWREYPCLK